ncbi:MAG TPA: globin domain-containing protein [Pseudomonadales bacterium]
MGDVMASFNRVRHGNLAGLFYQKLLAADGRIKTLFANTDFDKQQQLFTHGLLMLLEYASGKTMGKMAVRRLAESHSREKMAIDPALYSIWIDCLVETVKELDKEYVPELEPQWRACLQKGIDVMKAAY